MRGIKMNNKNYENSDIVVRRVNIDDNFEEMAELIYETDEYIYPYWFHDDVEEAKRVLPSLMKEEGFFFNYKSIYIAIDKNTNINMSPVAISTMFLLLLLLLLLLLKLRRIYFMLTGHLGGSKSQPAS